MGEMITVVTPTYNRGDFLVNCYESLNKQTTKNFIWLIIDDGSTDNTREIVEKICSISNFDIKYVYKKNGGKHTALNYAFGIINTELTFIVDSDDILSSDAIENIERDWSKYKNSGIAGISYLRGHSFEKVIGDEFPKSYKEFNPIDIQFRYNISGDKAEVWKTNILNKYRFPEYENEKFQGENYIWWQIGLKYNLLYVNKIIYVTEYQDGGLTKSGRRLRINCPYGGMENSKKGFHKKFPLKERVKRGIMFNCYRYFAKEKIRFGIKNSDKHNLLVFLTSLPGYVLYKIWKKKYLEE